ncbi:expressed protein [Dictyostelium purpureum]|uniref:Expressed protein n=1 Tax=Dictyostelium purpureum TaxID=5786 RepID=F0ZI89_DICPU|nr:uncharacterized protein DICPUDRAFT_94332 [Dictyostelium purpureum]EGC36335.1 expressed protein [Dictyostelium purpureum]|eukprot:XP_003287150.1 expressed protein [Dictyostelium purpureum]
MTLFNSITLLGSSGSSMKSSVASSSSSASFGDNSVAHNKVHYVPNCYQPSFRPCPPPPPPKVCAPCPPPPKHC